MPCQLIDMKTHRLTLLYCDTPNQMCNGTKIKMYLSIIDSYSSTKISCLRENICGVKKCPEKYRKRFDH